MFYVTFFVFLSFNSLISPSANINLSLNSILSGVELKSENVTINFKNLNIHNGKIEFDELRISANQNPIFSDHLTDSDRNKKLENEKRLDESQFSYFEYPELVSAIDESIDPCENFYDHVCRRWIDEHEIADDETSVGHMDLLTQRVHEQIQEVLDSNYTTHATKEHRLLHQFYEKCVDHKTLPDNRAFDIILKQMKSARERKSKTLLTSWMIEFRPMNFLIDVSVGINEFNSSLRILQVVPSQPTLSYNAYTKSQYKHEYLAIRQFLGELLDLLQFDDSDGIVFGGKAEEYEARIEAFFEVDRKLAEISNTNVYNKSTTVYEFKNLKRTLKSIDLSSYFETFAPSTLCELLESSEVQIIDEEGLTKLDQFISDLNETTLQYFLDWQTIMYFGEFFDNRYQEVMKGYSVALSGATTQTGDKDCMSTASNIFYDIMAEIYVRRYFPDKTRMEVTSMVGNILQSFESILQSNEWMDASTRNEALQKLHTIRQFVGFNDLIFNETWIQSRYRNLEFQSNDTYYSQMMKVQQWSQMLVLGKLNSTRSTDEFEFPSTDVNAFYDPSSNSIAIGHEITHGFDNSGAEYDKFGNRRNWWHDDTMLTFLNYSSCFVDQYSNITIDDTNLAIDGRLTLSENIADNGGIRAAMLALKNQKGSERQRILGLEKKTAMQLFFMSNAYVWCSKIRPQQVLARLYSDVHTPERYRVNTVFSNQPEFAEAFNCPAGSAMNPIEKCKGLDIKNGIESAQGIGTQSERTNSSSGIESNLRIPVKEKAQKEFKSEMKDTPSQEICHRVGQECD